MTWRASCAPAVEYYGPLQLIVGRLVNLQELGEASPHEGDRRCVLGGLHELVRQARECDPELAKEIKGLRWPTPYSLDNMPDEHVDSLAALRPETQLGRAYLWKEQLLEILRPLVHQSGQSVTSEIHDQIAAPVR
jgi:hypothetical protein